MASNKKLLDEACVLALFKCLHEKRAMDIGNNLALYAVYMDTLDSYISLFKEEGIEIMPLMDRIADTLISMEPDIAKKQVLLKEDTLPDEYDLDALRVSIRSVTSMKPQMDGFKGIRLCHEEDGRVCDNTFIQSCTGHEPHEQFFRLVAYAARIVMQKDTTEDYEGKKEEALKSLTGLYSDELERICTAYPAAITNMFRYFYGKQDYYSILVNFKKGQAVIKAFNPDNSLNAPETTLPKKVINVANKISANGLSNSTFVMTFDNGSQFEFRLYPSALQRDKKTVKAYSVEIKPTGVPVETHVSMISNS